MKKVLINLFSKKGDLLIDAVGYVDTEAKVLYIPGISKKGRPYIADVKIDYIKGNAAVQTVYTEDDRQFTNIYYIYELTEKGTK